MNKEKVQELAIQAFNKYQKKLIERNFQGDLNQACEHFMYAFIAGYSHGAIDSFSNEFGGGD